MNNTIPSNTILVLTDFSEASIIALRNAAKLVKLTNGNIHAYYVETVKPFAQEQNPLTLNGNLRDNHKKILAKAKRIIAAIEEEEGVAFSFTMDLGNIKNCILDQVKETQPDLIILGKRKSKFLDFIGDKVTQFVIDNCDTSVLICSSNRELHSFSDLSVGFYGETIEKSDFQIIDHLKQSTRSVRYFGVRSKMASLENNNASPKNANSYIFPQGGIKGIEALTSYVVRTDTQLFCIPNNTNLQSPPIKEMVRRLDIPILLYK